MYVRRLLVVATLLSSTFASACDNQPTGIDASESTMQMNTGARKDHTPWNRLCGSTSADTLSGGCRL